MMKRYNIALLPVDADLAAYCVGFAQRNFSAQQEGYLLGNDAVAHVTLCQFHAEAADIAKLWPKLRAMNAKQLCALSFAHLYFGAGRNDHTGMIWAGFAVAPQENLSELQAGVHDLVAAQGLQPLTAKGADYFPHLTLARLDVFASLTVQNWPEQEFWDQRHGFGLSLGLSDENGVYQQCLHADFECEAVRATAL